MRPCCISTASGAAGLPTKRFGLFEFVQTGDDPMLDGIRSPMRVPHSRWNDLAESDLRAHGYEVLTRSGEAGVDIFAKQWNSLFVFLQGHPEYDADTLFREYRRDMTRYLRGERDDLPGLPVALLRSREASGPWRACAAGQGQGGADLAARLPECGMLTEAIDAMARFGDPDLSQLAALCGRP